jgi:multidrug resistance efflux pump
MPVYSPGHSEEIQDIIGTSPPWLLRAGAGYILLLLLLLLALSAGVRYPDVLPAAITITTDPAPFTAVTRASGPLQLLVHEGQLLAPGQVVGIIEDAAAYADVQALAQAVASPQASLAATFAGRQLGALQAPYEAFRKAASDYRQFQLADDYRHQLRTLADEVSAYEHLNHNLTSQQQLQAQELGLVGKRYTIDNGLLRDKVIAQTDVDASQRLLLQQQKSVASSQANIITNTITATELRRRMLELRAQQVERQQQLQLAQEQAERTLRNAVAEWQQAHVLVTRIPGRVALLKEWVAGQVVPAATPVLSVLPPATTLAGRLRLPVQGSGKVHPGQRVNIMLHNYPSEQFGMLEGQVARVAPLPQSNTYDVVVQLPAHLVTTYHHPIVFKQQLQGQAEIITEDLSLLQRVFYQFRGLWQGK